MSVKLQKPYYSFLARAISDGISSGHYSGNLIPTEKELGNEYEVSRITVRKALKILEENKTLDATQGKRRRITRKPKLRSLQRANRERKIICLTVHETPCYSTMSNTINIEAQRDHIALTSLIFERDSGLERFRDYFLSEHISGIICIGVPTIKQVQEIKDIGLPVVFAGFNHPKVEDSVETDNYTGGYIVGEHLVKNGHKNILLINSLYQLDSAFYKREEGFAKAMNEYEAQFKCYRKMKGYRSVGDENELLKLLTTPLKPTAIFTTSDSNIPILFSFFRKNNIDPYTDFSIIGYDNMVNVFEPDREDIDSIDQPWEEIAKCAFERLIEKIENPDTHTKKVIQIKPKLIIKGSVKQI
jgi:DNA-binding LacI/PurR family transcriptional regulator